jgi:hypothetical protein
MDNLQNNIQEEKGIYLTSADILSSRNKELPDIYYETELSDEKSFRIKEKIQLPPILRFRNYHNKKSHSTFENDLKNAKFHSYFSPENFLNYNESCNKFIAKPSSILKESLSPEKIIYKNRIYDLNEFKLLSDLKKDEMIKRSPGQGIFMRIQTYRSLNKKRPFKLVLSSLEAGKYNFTDNENNNNTENNNKIEVIENNKLKSHIKNKKSIRPKIHHLYKEKKFVPRRSSIMVKPMNDIIRTFKEAPKVSNISNNENEYFTNIGKLNDFDNKFRDKNILNALEKCGEDDMKYLIGM